jgi:hypothetical protein
MFAVNKLKTLKPVDDEKNDLEAKFVELQSSLKDRQKKHFDLLYSEERKHNMECQ